jgi:acyl-CoA reductase-like NAD-dependent aldehyde dehydrogenase
MNYCQRKSIQYAYQVQRRYISFDLQSLRQFAEHQVLVNNAVKITDLKKFHVTNPANGDIIGELPSANDVVVSEQSKRAFDSWQSWKQTTGYERSRYLRNMVS